MEPQQTAVPVTTSSFMTRATNVFASPGELYSEVATAPPQTSSWLLPYIAAIVLAIVAVFAVYNNTSLRQQVFDMQSQGWQKAVEQGKMSQQQADQMKDRMESSGPMMFMLFGSGFAVVGLTIYFFGISLVLWLIIKLAFKSTAAYGKMLEIYGLASLIAFFGSIITLLMMNLLDSMHATPGGALLVMNSYDRNNFVHNVLLSLNVFTIWQVIVLGIGIAKASNKSHGTGIATVFGLWTVWVIIASALGWVR